MRNVIILTLALLALFTAEGLSTVALAETGDAERERSPESGTEVAPKRHGAGGAHIGADTLLESGKYGEALSAYQSILKEKPDDIRAHLGAARAYLESGEYEPAEKMLEFFGAITSTVTFQLTPEQLLELAKGVWLLANRTGDKNLFHKVAGDYLPRIGELDKTNPELFVFWGRCYLDKGDTGEAVGCFNDALKLDPKNARARLGIAEAAFSRDPLLARPQLKELFSQYPDYPDGMAMMALTHMIEENTNQAIEDINKSLSANPNSSYYRAIKAGIYYLNNQPDLFQKECQNILNVNKRPAVFYLTLGDICLKRMFYPEAQGFYQKAVEFDPHLWDAYVALGLNSLRLGSDMEAQGKKLLDEAFQRDPFNVTVFNTIKVMEGLQSDYETIQTKHFNIKIHKSEKELLAPYVSELLENCYDKFTALYQFEPTTPLAVEVMEDHNDFSVRTLGIPGFGALGVCFAKTFLVLSPSVQDQLAKRFHWGAITAHEFMHVITLQMSKFRVPRWFTEGCSVYAEKLANPIWGRELEIDIIQAQQAGKLEHLTQFNKTRRVDILHTYLLSSVIIEYIHKTYGMDKISRMLKLFATGKDTDTVFKECLDKTLEQFDQEFFKYLDETLIKPNDLKSLAAHLKKGEELYNQDKYAEAVSELTAAKQAFPRYVKPMDNPYYYLIRLYEDTENEPKLITELEEFVRVNQNDFNARQKLYRLYHKNPAATGTDKMLALLNETIYLEPENIQLHSYLAEAYAEKKNYPKALQEYRIGLHLLNKVNPTPNRNLVIADFYCNIARIYLLSGNKDEAKKSLAEAAKAYPDYKRIKEIMNE